MGKIGLGYAWPGGGDMKRPYRSLEDFIVRVMWFVQRDYLPEEYNCLTKTRFLRLCAEAIEGLDILDCVLCGVDTSEIGEYYMVTDTIWGQYGSARGCLCIGCLEKQMGRELRRDDFKYCPANDPAFSPRSERLLDRMGLAHA